EFNKQPVEKTIETIGQDKNGNEIPLEISLSDWNSDNRKFFTAIIRDVTARKNYEQELRNIGEKYQSIINTTSEGYWLLDRNLNTIEVNDSLCEMLGYSRDEMIGKKPRDFVDEENAQIFAAQHAAREKVDQRKYEVTLLGKNGEKIYSVFNATSLRDPDGNLAGSFAFVSDISIHKRAEEVLIEAKAHADAANRAKSEFLSSMSHELRTPMNAILGFGQLLDNNPKEPLSESQKDFVAQILKGGEHLLDLINEVLDLAKIEAGRIPLTMESVCIADVIEECMILMQPQAEKLKVSLIDKTRKNDLPNLWVDSTRFKQILLNFMSNAVKYNIPEGTVTLESSPCDDGYLRITVKDTGMGISEFKQMHLFEPFSRLGADQTNIEGTGIGLTITKNLVELMNGRIGFESVSGKGSSFWFEFPISVHDNSADYKKLNNSTDRSEIASQNITEVRKLLYVEDNPENLRLMEGIVNGIPNLSLVSAHTAELGIELAKSDKPDLILMDIHLPGKNGIEALKILQNMDDTKDIPVIALSAAARLEDISRGNEAGFYRYLTKPFKINEVVSTIEDALESSHG
ncbi:MAG: PAS domain S-box protein, partial [Rhodospirillales bacterium]|nr:PAS domain S-box protein [Rhodospirillales bacterium]